MTCDNCNMGMVTVDKSIGAENGGWFKEEYSCTNCGAKGFVSGESSAPAHQWDKYGTAFGGPA